MSAPPDIRVQFGSTALYDVTDRVKSVSISRGKSRELDRFTTGQATIVFTNQDRAFDPFYDSSPYFGDIKPRRRIIIDTIVGSSTATQFTGIIEDWDLNYDVGGLSDAAIACADGFILFGGQQLEFGTATPQTTGERLEAILDRPEVDWPTADRDIDTGSGVLGADVIEQGRDVLEYMQLIETTELGQLFMTKTNSVAFRDRNRGVVFAEIEFSDDPSSTLDPIPYRSIAVTYGTEFLYNRAVVTNLGGNPQTSENTSSIAEYGVSSLEMNGILVSNDTQSADIAAYLTNVFGEPELRIDSLRVQLSGLLLDQQNQVLSLDLGDIIRVGFKPNNIGDRIVQEVQVIGIRHDIRPASHEVELALASARPISFVFGAGTAAEDNIFSLFAGGDTPGSPLGL